MNLSLALVAGGFFKLLGQHLEKASLFMKTIHFVDYGQDFLEFDIDHQGNVLKVRPFQGWAWSNIQVTNHVGIERGDFVSFTRNGNPTPRFICYPVSDVTTNPSRI